IELFVGQFPLTSELRTQTRDWIVQAIFFQFLLLPVNCWIGHRVSAVAISTDFEERRMRLLPNRMHNLGDLIANFAKVHPIDDFPWDVVALGPIDNLLKRCRSLYRGAHSEEVVFANEYDRQFIKRGQIQSFVESSLIDRAVTEEAERDPIFAQVLGGKRHSHRQWNVGADNSVTTVHVIFPIEEMHGAPQA